MNFPTQYTKRKSPISPAGSELYANYKLKDGDVVPDGTYTNIQDKIDSFYESCEINHIMMRFNSGDQSVIDQVRGVYGDFTDMPSTYAELHDRLVHAREFFNSLKPDVREMFDNNPIKFFDSMGSKEFMEKLEYLDKKHNVSASTQPVSIDPTPAPEERSIL